MADDWQGCLGCLGVLAILALFSLGLGLVIDGFGEEGQFVQGDYIVSEEARRGYEAAGDALGQPVESDDPIYTRERKWASGSSAKPLKIVLGFLIMGGVIGGVVFLIKKF